jgi:hypothetical protein
MTLNLSNNNLKVLWRMHIGNIRPSNTLTKPVIVRLSSSATQSPLRGDRGQSPQLGAFGTRSKTFGIQFNSGIGGESLVDLHNQILTLKETIISLEPILKEDKDSEDIAFKNKTCLENVTFEIEDFIKLQEEYNKLIFKKHQV